MFCLLTLLLSQLPVSCGCHPPLPVSAALCSRSATTAIHFWSATLAAHLQSVQLFKMQIVIDSLSDHCSYLLCMRYRGFLWSTLLYLTWFHCCPLYEIAWSSACLWLEMKEVLILCVCVLHNSTPYWTIWPWWTQCTIFLHCILNQKCSYAISTDISTAVAEGSCVPFTWSPACISCIVNWFLGLIFTCLSITKIRSILFQTSH